MFCSHCGTPVSPGENYCASCGHDLRAPGSVRLTDPHSVPRSRNEPSWFPERPRAGTAAGQPVTPDAGEPTTVIPGRDATTAIPAQDATTVRPAAAATGARSADATSVLPPASADATTVLPLGEPDTRPIYGEPRSGADAVDSDLPPEWFRSGPASEPPKLVHASRRAPGDALVGARPGDPEPEPMHEDRPRWRSATAVIVGVLALIPAAAVAAVVYWWNSSPAPRIAPPSASKAATKPAATGGAGNSTKATATASSSAATSSASATPTAVITVPAGVRDCGSGVSAGPNTSCAFALAVKQNLPSTIPVNKFTVTAYSPTSRHTYTMICQASTTLVGCNGGATGTASMYIKR